MQQPTSAVRILQFNGSNFMKLRPFALEFDDQDNLVVIGGDNAQGKTAMLMLIQAIFGGADELPDEPIRDGCEKAYGEAVLSNGITVKRVITRKGTRLIVTDESGEPVTSPQAAMNKLLGALAFDPLAFANSKPAEQRETLKRLVGLDFTDIDADRSKLFNLRHDVKKQRDQLVAQTGALHADVPDTEINVAEAVSEMQKIAEAKAARATASSEATTAQNNVTVAQNDLTATEGACALDLEAAEQVVKQAELAVEKAKADLKACVDTNARVVAERKHLINVATQGAQQAAEALEAMPEPDESRVAELQALVETSAETNAKVRENKANAERQQQAKDLAGKIRDIENKMDSIDEDKAAQLRNADFPVEGLAFDAEGVTYNGLPFSQASTAEQLRVSVAMAIALNPTLRVLLIKDGSLLDDKSMKTVAEMARDAGMQVFMERVGQGDEVRIIIDDGRVTDVEADTPADKT